MTYFTDLFSSSLIQAVGWTLFHSLWQSLLCIVIVIALMRYIPSRLSNARYTLATGGLLTIFLMSVATFLYMMHMEVSMPQESDVSFNQTFHNPSQVTEFDSMSGLVTSITSHIQSNITLIVASWIIGAMLSSLRVFSGWWYLKKLRNNAIELDNEWSVPLQKLAKDIGVNKWITLAESSLIHAPIVIGCIKPIILVPVGMCAGLSTKQLESIFLHELIHLRRGDYFVNMIQVLLEALFFFNPFVWIISGIMRREREHCCDDAVVKLHGNPLAYVHALATLEEVRLSNAGLALSLAENKNQLLNRIKRIMEKSVKSYSTRERIVPVALLIIGLVCASWLTIQSGRPEQGLRPKSIQETVTNDTTIKQKSARYYKKKVTTIEEDGNPKDEIVVEIEGDEALSEMLSIDNDFDVQIPAFPSIPDFDVAIPPIPDFDFTFRMDTISPPDMRMDGDWEAFSKAFEENFKARFGDFYEKHGEELKSMMENMEFKLNHQFENDWASKMEEFALKQEQLARMQLEQSEEVLARHEMQARKMEEKQKEWEKENAEHLEAMEQNVKIMEEQLKAHEKSQKALFKELTTELIKDGYFKEGEKVNSLQMDDKNMAFNGKSIKASDYKKYRALFEKYSTGRSEKELRKEFSKALEGRRE
jgi:bla regulator protein blaR1